MGVLLPQTVYEASQIGREIPESLDNYRRRGGYEAFRRILHEGPQEVLSVISDAELRGRGGAAFPTARKWAELLKSPSRERYLVVNGAEGEPGSMKDRVLMGVAPHALLEGLLISGITLGVSQVIVYINNHFPEAVQALTDAYHEWQEEFPVDVGFPIEFRAETHVYIAGEETALISVLNGEGAMPRLKPPYPTTDGYRHQPTVVNNVETLAHIPVILRLGASWYRQHRPALFSVAGDVKNPGVYEVSRGISVRELLDLAGGPPAPMHIMGLLPGGYSMPWLTADQFHLALDEDSLKAAGSGLGASLIALGDHRSWQAVAAEILAFFARETCGQCPLCVRGTRMFHDFLSLKDRPYTAQEVQQILDKAPKYRHKGICSFMDTAVRMAESAAPFLPIEPGNLISQG